MCLRGWIIAPHHLQRLHVTLNLVGELILSHFQIVARLKIHPKCRCVLEVAGEALCGVRGNPTPLVDDIGDSSQWDAQVHRHWERDGSTIGWVTVEIYEKPTMHRIQAGKMLGAFGQPFAGRSLLFAGGIPAALQFPAEPAYASLWLGERVSFAGGSDPNNLEL